MESFGLVCVFYFLCMVQNIHSSPPPHGQGAVLNWSSRDSGRVALQPKKTPVADDIAMTAKPVPSVSSDNHCRRRAPPANRPSMAVHKQPGMGNDVIEQPQSLPIIPSKSVSPHHRISAPLRQRVCALLRI